MGQLSLPRYLLVMPAAVCFLATVEISSHLAYYIASAQKGQICLLISPFRFMKNLESSFHPREGKAWWVVHCSVMPEKHFALSNCPAPNVSVDLKLSRGIGDHLLLPSEHTSLVFVGLFSFGRSRGLVMKLSRCYSPHFWTTMNAWFAWPCGRSSYAVCSVRTSPQ